MQSQDKGLSFWEVKQFEFNFDHILNPNFQSISTDTKEN